MNTFLKNNLANLRKSDNTLVEKHLLINIFIVNAIFSKHFFIIVAEDFMSLIIFFISFKVTGSKNIDFECFGRQVMLRQRITIKLFGNVYKM